MPAQRRASSPARSRNRRRSARRATRSRGLACRCRRGRDDQPHPRRLRRHLSHRRRRRGLVPRAAGAADHGRRPGGGMPALRTADARRAAATGPTARRDIEYRAYAVQPESPFIGRSVRDLEAWRARRACSSSGSGARDRIVDADGSTVMQAATRWHHRAPGTAHRAGRRAEARGPRSRRPPLLEIPAEVLDVVVTSPTSTAARSTSSPDEDPHAASICGGSCAAGTPVAIFPATRVQRGDVLTLVGPDTANRAGREPHRDRRSRDRRHRHGRSWRSASSPAR